MILDIREKKKYWLIIGLIVLIFTTVNNYYFYSYVQYSVVKDVEQLELILSEDLKYFRTNKISDKKYREHTKVIIKQFAKKAQYNKSVTLNYKNAILKGTGKFKKGYEPWETEKDYEKVVQSTIKIIVPKLNSNEYLEYTTNIKEVSFLDKAFLLSVFRSMTLSFTDVIEDIPKMNFSDVWNNWQYRYFPRSRNPVVFFVVLWVLLFRIRKYQIRLYEKQVELSNKINKLEEIISDRPNEDIQKIIHYAKNKEVKKLKLLLTTGISIDTKDSEGMTALMLYTLEDSVSKNEKEVIKILLNNGANIDEQNNVGMTTLMLCSMNGKDASAQVLIDNGADITVKQELTAADIATPSIKEMINKTQNTNPQELVKILSNFTNKPMKFTTHTWDFGSLESAFGTFDEAMEAVKKQFDGIDKELEVLSFSLHKKITLFLFNVNPTTEDSWCSKADINIGWLSLDGLREHCDNGKNAFDFPLKEKTIVIDNNELNTFGDIINLFKQEIEVRTDFNNLEQIFSNEKKKLGRGFKLNLVDAKLQRQFYTDTQSFSFAIEKIFAEIKKRKEYSNIEVSTREFEDRSLEIKIIQIGSNVDKSAKTLIDEVQSGDFADIKEALTNLCDWSIESICEDGSYRVNYLHSNNIGDVEQLTTEVKGFTHVLRFYR